MMRTTIRFRSSRVLEHRTELTKRLWVSAPSMLWGGGRWSLADTKKKKSPYPTEQFLVAPISIEGAGTRKFTFSKLVLTGVVVRTSIAWCVLVCARLCVRGRSRSLGGEGQQDHEVLSAVFFPRPKFACNGSDDGKQDQFLKRGRPAIHRDSHNPAYRRQTR